jgi:sRNA-binding regulator protein Hfq
MAKRTEQRPTEDPNPLDGLQVYMKAHEKDSVFEREVGKESSWCLFFHGSQRRKGRIRANSTYEFDLLSQDGTVEQAHKVRVKMLCEASREQEVLERLKTNESKKAAPEGPHFGPRYRHHIKNKTLFPLMNRKEVLFFTTLEGDVLRGVVTGFSRFEINLSMKGGVPVVLLRHAVLDVMDKKGRSYTKEAVEKTGKYW